MGNPSGDSPLRLFVHDGSLTGLSAMRGMAVGQVSLANVPTTAIGAVSIVPYKDGRRVVWGGKAVNACVHSAATKAVTKAAMRGLAASLSANTSSWRRGVAPRPAARLVTQLRAATRIPQA